MEMKEQEGHVNAGFDSNGKKVADPDGIDLEAAPIPNKKPSKVDQLWDVSAIFYYLYFSWTDFVPFNFFSFLFFFCQFHPFHIPFYEVSLSIRGSRSGYGRPVPPPLLEVPKNKEKGKRRKEGGK